MSQYALTGGYGAIVFLPDWEARINNELRHEFKTLGEEIEGTAKWLVPVDTGELRDSIYNRVRQPAGEIYVEVGATAPHAEFVEYGTGTRGRRTYNRGPSGGLRDFPKPDDYVHGPKRGMEAQPYLRPAMMMVVQRRYG